MRRGRISRFGVQLVAYSLWLPIQLDRKIAKRAKASKRSKHAEVLLVVEEAFK